jgi:hypothetical protein
MTTKNVILDTAIDVLRCYECREEIGPDESKVIIGYGRISSSEIYHPGCQPEEHELKEAFRQARQFIGWQEV